MKAYKYRGVKDFERDVLTLKENKIYAAPFKDLNDPFEGVCNDSITKVAEMLEKLFNTDASEVIEVLDNIKAFKSKLGVYSLCKSHTNELLWAHYAESHKGFCIEYDVAKLKYKYLVPKTVNELHIDYMGSPQSITTNDISKSQNLLKKLFATKSKLWKYEEEIRLIFDSAELKSYHPSALTGIYFGVEMENRLKEKLIESTKNGDVKFYDIYRENSSYKLKRKLVHENHRTINKKLDPSIFEIVSTKHNAAVENFNVLYKGRNIRKENLNSFFEGFRENFATKPCNINLFDNKSVMHLFDRTKHSDEEYINLADHYIAMSDFSSPEAIWEYPYQDSQYLERGGTNFKKIKSP